MNVEKNKKEIEPQTDPIDSHGEVFTSFGVVYVNELARHPMFEAKIPKFPTGSIIVREKRLTESSTSPDLLSVMIKRNKGFNTAEGDWEFVVLDYKSGKARAIEKTIDCLSCHGKQRNSDFVFRKYLSDAARLSQK